MGSGDPRRAGAGFRAAWILVVASLLPAVAFGLLQAREDAAVDRYLHDRGLAGLPLTRATTLRVSQAVRADFVVDESKWKSYSLSSRPFLRHDTEFLLRAREGLCGQGARVLVNLLDRLGFDATRLTLYDVRFRPAHTLVSVIVDGHEELLDSINTGDSLNAFLNRAHLSTADFGLLHYTDDILARSELGRQLVVRDTVAADPAREEFFSYFHFYSYEALPVTKLLTRAGIDWRVFVLERPARWISALAEKPRAVLALLWLVIAVVVDAPVLLVARSRARRAART